ncbi:MAG: hypothetical protein WKF61_08545 [Luteimonas sp.]
MLILTSTLAGQARAEQASTTKSNAPQLSVNLDFKIVIHDTLRLDPRDELGPALRQFVSRTTEVHRDRIVLTVAKL